MLIRTMLDVHIIGAGPSGSVAALSALRKGYNVTISEEHNCSGLPMHCSGLFSKTGLDSLREFFDYKKLIINPIKGAIIDFAGERVEIKTTGNIAYVCDRTALDQEIANNAINEGVKVEYGKRIANIDQLKAKIVIGADGPFSNVAMNFNFPKISKYASTIQGYFRYASGVNDCSDSVQVYLDNEKFPGFFGWVIPHNEEIAEIGAGVTLPNNVSRAWDNILKITGVDKKECKPKGAVIPIRVRSRTALRKGKYKVCLVGDAAGQTKATTGGGVIFGSNCARYAGMLCNSPLRYELEWRMRFGLNLFIHKSIQSALESYDNLQIARLGKTIRKLGIDNYLSNHGHMDMPMKMVKPELIGHMLKSVPNLL